MKALVGGLLLLVSCKTAWADDAATREQIRQDREAIEMRHSLQEQKCRQQFVVTPCLEKVRAAKQKALKALRTQEDALDEAQRRQRSLEQARRVSDKARAAEARESASAAREPKSPRVAAPMPAKLPAPPRVPAPDRSAAEKQRREAFEARRSEIQEHRQAVEKRNAERATRKPAKPLPVPASAGLP